MRLFWWDTELFEQTCGSFDERRVTWLIHMCDMTHPDVWHDSFMCVTHRLFWWKMASLLVCTRTMWSACQTLPASGRATRRARRFEWFLKFGASSRIRLSRSAICEDSVCGGEDLIESLGFKVSFFGLGFTVLDRISFFRLTTWENGVVWGSGGWGVMM